MNRLNKIPKIACLCTVISFVSISCNRHIQLYSYVPKVDSDYSLTGSERTETNTRKSIVLTSDTSLNYSILLGGVGISTTINYKTIDTLIYIDSIDIYNRNTFQNYTNEIFNHKFIFSKDSLVDLTNGEKFFSPRHIDKYSTIQKWNKLYIIVDGRKKKISSLNFKRILSKIDINKFKFSEMSKSEAKERFGIKPKYITFVLSEK